MQYNTIRFNLIYDGNLPATMMIGLMISATIATSVTIKSVITSMTCITRS